MPDVHPTATLTGDVVLHDDVTIGPNCVLTGPVTVGTGTRLVGNVYLQGPLTLGRDNIVYPFTCLGFAAQHLNADPAAPGQGLIVGDHNTLRENVTMHRAFFEDGPTRVGSHNLFMAGAHVAHDSIVGDRCTFVNNAGTGGHVVIEDRVTIGGFTGIHQFCRVGRGAMLGGGISTSRDVAPFFMLTGITLVGAVNLVGMRRAGMTREQINTVRWVYRTLYRSGLPFAAATEALRTRTGDPLVDEYLRFIAASKRGLCPARGQAARGTLTVET